MDLAAFYFEGWDDDVGGGIINPAAQLRAQAQAQAQPDDTDSDHYDQAFGRNARERFRARPQAQPREHVSDSDAEALASDTDEEAQAAYPIGDWLPPHLQGPSLARDQTPPTEPQWLSPAQSIPPPARNPTPPTETQSQHEEVRLNQADGYPRADTREFLGYRRVVPAMAGSVMSQRTAGVVNRIDRINTDSVNNRYGSMLALPKTGYLATAVG